MNMPAKNILKDSGIIKFVIAKKIEDANEKRALTKKRSQVEFLKSLKKQKEMQKLEGMPLEEIEKQIEELEA